MRAAALVSVSIAAMLAASCGSSEAASKPSDGTLVLEVGGANSSLREALSAAGVAMGEARRLRSVEPEPVPDPVEPSPQPVHEPEPRVEPERSPVAPEPPQPTRYRTVVLERGQTLIHLAKIHLGNGNRFREILTANGWSEAQARRLAEGTKVKVPIDDDSTKAKR